MSDFALIQLTNGQVRHNLKNSPFCIGRSPTAHIILRSIVISRNHCYLENTDGRWYIFDQSSSGTFVNDQLVGKGNSRVLCDGDTLRLGPAAAPDHEPILYKFSEPSKPAVESQKWEVQSQMIADLNKEKTTLEDQMSARKSNEMMMKMELLRMEKVFANKLREAENRHCAERELMKNQSKEGHEEMERRAALEKEEIATEVEKHKRELLMKLEENKAAEEELRQEVDRLHNKLADEERRWQQRLNEMKAELEHELRSKEADLEARREEMSRAAEQKQNELGERLSKEEAEKKALSERLELMTRHLEEAAVRAAAEREHFEAEKQREVERSAQLLQQYHADQISQLQQSKMRVEDVLKAELEKKQQAEQRVEQLLTEKSSTSSTSTCLENFEQLLESELQCVICSEPFITAITLNCTHTFCKFCLEQWKKTQKTCPVCRTRITSENRALAMDNFITKMVESLSEDFQKRRDATVAERKEAEKPPPARGRGRRSRGRGGTAAQRGGARTARNEAVERYTATTPVRGAAARPQIVPPLTAANVTAAVNHAWGMIQAQGPYFLPAGRILGFVQTVQPGIVQPVQAQAAVPQPQNAQAAQAPGGARAPEVVTLDDSSVAEVVEVSTANDNPANDSDEESIITADGGGEDGDTLSDEGIEDSEEHERGSDETLEDEDDQYLVDDYMSLEEFIDNMRRPAPRRTYGYCYVCYASDHWAPECPQRRR